MLSLYFWFCLFRLLVSSSLSICVSVSVCTVCVIPCTIMKPCLSMHSVLLSTHDTQIIDMLFSSKAYPLISVRWSNLQGREPNLSDLPRNLINFLTTAVDLLLRRNEDAGEAPASSSTHYGNHYSISVYKSFPKKRHIEEQKALNNDNFLGCFSSDTHTKHQSEAWIYHALLLLH